jgi:hypothetical protein
LRTEGALKIVELDNGDARASRRMKSGGVLDLNLLQFA